MRKNEEEPACIDVESLKRVSEEFCREAWKLMPVAENYLKFKIDQQERFDAALEKLRVWIDHMKPEDVSDFSEELKMVVRIARDNGEYPDFMGSLKSKN